MSKTFMCEGGCGAEVKEFKRRKTRLCKVCCGRALGSDPARVEKSRQGMKRRMADPAFKAAHIRRTSDGLRARLASDPAEMERRRESGRALARTGLGHAAQGAGSEPRRRVAEKQTERYLGWCPLHLRDHYRDLVNKKGIRAADARQIIENEMAVEERRMTPFEKQLQRIRNGETTVVKKFTPSTAQHAFTLGGVATGMI